MFETESRCAWDVDAGEDGIRNLRAGLTADLGVLVGRLLNFPGWLHGPTDNWIGESSAVRGLVLIGELDSSAGVNRYLRRP